MTEGFLKMLWLSGVILWPFSQNSQTGMVRFQVRPNHQFRDQSLLMVGGGAEDIKGGSPMIFLPRWGGQIKNQTARGGAVKNNQLKLTSILFRNK